MPCRFVLSLEQHEVTVSSAQQKSRHYDEQKLRCFSMNKEGTKVVSKKTTSFFMLC